MINPTKIKKDFPIFRRKINGKYLVYLDNAATTQKPTRVINGVANFYRRTNAPIHRSVYTIAEEASQLFEETRKKVAKFINATERAEIIFTRGTTESLNLIAYTLGRNTIGVDDNIVLTEMEHHSNLIPWQILAKEKQAELRFIPFDEQGMLQLEALERLIDRRTKILSIVHVSNFLGTFNPVEKIIAFAKKRNPSIITVVDGAQSAPHMKINVQKIGCDFFAFSSHKMLGPAGVGVLWGKKELLENMPPFLTGGSMISLVSYKEAEFNEVPYKFEAGTPNIEGVIGFRAALLYLSQFSMAHIRAHEKELTHYCVEKMNKIPRLRIIGPQNPNKRGGLIAFTLGEIHPHDIASFLNDDGICIRVGHHCVMPAHQKLGVPASARVSFYMYNDKRDIDEFIVSLKKVVKAIS